MATTTTTTTTKTVLLFQNTNQQYHVFDLRNPVHVVRKVADFDFTNSSNALVYVAEGKLRALPLRSGTILSSVSELSPLCYTPKPQAGYVFRAKDEEMIISVSDFPVHLLSGCPVTPDEAPVGVTFTSGGGILSLWSHMTLISWTNDDTGSFAFAADTSFFLRQPNVSYKKNELSFAFTADTSFFSSQPSVSYKKMCVLLEEKQFNFHSSRSRYPDIVVSSGLFPLCRLRSIRGRAKVQCFLFNSFSRRHITSLLY